MSKRSQKLFIIISITLGVLFLAALLVAARWLPPVVNSLIDVKDNFGDRQNITYGGRVFIIADAYAMLAVAVFTVVILFILLRVVYKHRVFSKTATRLISAVSWGCFIEGLLALLLVYYFQLVICFTLAACFLGLCLRITKTVIEEATAIKSENDFTI